MQYQYPNVCKRRPLYDTFTKVRYGNQLIRVDQHLNAHLSRIAYAGLKQ